MGKTYQKLFTVFLLLTFSTLSFSQEVNEEKLSFEEALNIAFDHNPQMIEAKKAIESSKGDLITARTFQNPEAELEFGGLKKNEDGDRNTNLDSIEIRQPLDPIGVRFFKSKIASNQVKIQAESLRSAWASVYLQVREVYSRNILDIKELELAQDNLNAMRQFFGRVQQRYQSGQALKNDFQRAKIELLSAEHAYLAAEKNLKTDQARLNLILGRPMETEFEVVEKLEEEDLQISFEKLKSIALANRPDIKIANLEVDSKNKTLVKEQLNRFPSYFLGFKRINEEERDDYAVLVGISLPFWNLNQGEVKKAKAQKETQIVRSEAVKNEALFNVYEAYLEAELSQKQFELSKKSLEEANELLRLANLRYSEGKIDFLNYLDQIKTATQAKVNYYEGLFNLSRSISALEASIYSSLRQEEFFNEKF
jgi:cobalt-zinc-cadmium efflux system outer membrane protein